MKNGWHREQSDDRTVLEYWRRETHGEEYQCLSVYTDSDGKFTVRRANCDQFGYLSRSYDLTGQPTADVACVTRLLQDQIEQYPGADEYDGSPSFPDCVGLWTAVTRQYHNGADVTKWAFDPDTEYRKDVHEAAEEAAAIFELEQTDYSGGYCSSSILCTIRYVDEDGAATVATDVPRTFAFEIVVNSLSALSQPVAQCQLPTAEAVGFRAVTAVTTPVSSCNRFQESDRRRRDPSRFLDCCHRQTSQPISRQTSSRLITTTKTGCIRFS